MVKAFALPSIIARGNRLMVAEWFLKKNLEVPVALISGSSHSPVARV